MYAFLSKYLLCGKYNMHIMLLLGQYIYDISGQANKYKHKWFAKPGKN